MSFWKTNLEEPHPFTFYLFYRRTDRRVNAEDILRRHRKHDPALRTTMCQRHRFSPLAWTNTTSKIRA